MLKVWKDQISPTAPEQYEYPVRLFEDLHGAIPVKDITVDHIRSFRDAVKRNSRLHQVGKLAGLTMQRMIQVADGQKLTTHRRFNGGKKLWLH